jgi:hypothetical protein
MGRRSAAWAAWKRVAQRAAEFQAQVLFFLLYFAVLVPMSWPGRAARRRAFESRAAWHPHDASTAGIERARSQF